MNVFRAYDDLGTIKVGSLKECRRAIINWVQSDAAKEVYSCSDIQKIKRFFKDLTDSEALKNQKVEYFGFIIERILN